jgi:hypothetical protein
MIRPNNLTATGRASNGQRLSERTKQSPVEPAASFFLTAPKPHQNPSSAPPLPPSPLASKVAEEGRARGDGVVGAGGDAGGARGRGEAGAARGARASAGARQRAGPPLPVPPRPPHA